MNSTVHANINSITFTPWCIDLMWRKYRASAVWLIVNIYHFAQATKMSITSSHFEIRIPNLQILIRLRHPTEIVHSELQNTSIFCLLLPFILISTFITQGYILISHVCNIDVMFTLRLHC